MNRTFTCITVLAMVLVAVGVCVKQTIEFRGLLESSTIAMLFTAEGITAGMAIASCVSLLRRRFARQKKPLSRRPVPASVQA